MSIDAYKMDTDKIIKDTRKKIDELYLMSGYMDKYGKDVWISSILCIIFIILICYFALTNVLEVVKINWPYQRCNPMFMPFAGFINKPVGVSSFEYTAGNFNECINSILIHVAQLAVQPFRIMIAMVGDSIQSLMDSANSLRKTFKSLSTTSEKLIKQIYAGLSNLSVAFINFTVKMKDTMEKTNGMLTSALFVLFGSYMAMESLFLSILDLITLILIIIAAIIVLFIILAMCFFPVPIIGAALSAPFIVSAITTGVIMLAILIPIIWFEVMMLRVLDLSVAPPPAVPSCFAGDTLISLFEKGERCIKDIRLGDILANGGRVNAIMKFAAADQRIYKLNEVIVTGEHRVFHPERKWIKVKDHPESIALPDFQEPYVYCLNTDAKEFMINGTLFSDWDDIDTKVLNDLQQNCHALPANFTYADIHTYLARGFHPDTTVKLKDGSIVPLTEVKINDLLAPGTHADADTDADTDADAKVLGIIQVSGEGIKLYKHSLGGDSFIRGSKNIHIADNDLGIINSMLSHSEPIPILYHLLTDTKFFIANGVKVHDYNYGIDAYLT